MNAQCIFIAVYIYLMQCEKHKQGKHKHTGVFSNQSLNWAKESSTNYTYIVQQFEGQELLRHIRVNTVLSTFSLNFSSSTAIFFLTKLLTNFVFST